MNPVTVKLLPSDDGLVGTEVDGTDRGVYVDANQNGAPPGPWECVWDDGFKLIFVRAQHGRAGLIIEVRVEDNPPPPPASAALPVPKVA